MVETTQTSRFWPHLYEPLKGLGTRISEWLSPASEASSDDNAYTISIELPGVSEDDIDLRIENDSLVITGEKTEAREDKGETWYFSERQYGSFRRSFRLPPDADPSKAEAHAKDGVLEVTVPRRTQESSQAHKIEIKKL
jgi:HSP20 family protein